MGIILANQKSVPTEQIAEFKRNLQILFISGLFVFLAARLDFSGLSGRWGPALLFLGLLVAVVRPLAVGLSAIGTKLPWKEQLFISALAPRGIVSAAVASLFALDLQAIGHPDGEILTQLTFVVIIGTVLIAGAVASPLAKGLGLAQQNPQGTLFIGAEPWVRSLAAEIKRRGYATAFVDTNWANVADARVAGFPTYHGNILSEEVWEELDLGGIGRVLAMTPNNEVNSLVAQRFADVVGRSHVYQLPPEPSDDPKKGISGRLSGRLLFDKGLHYDRLEGMFDAGATIKSVPVTEAGNLQSFRRRHDGRLIPLFAAHAKSGKLIPVPADGGLSLIPGQELICLALPAPPA